MRIQENTIDIGWQETTDLQIDGTVRHVSATNLNSTIVPPNQIITLASYNPDTQTWSSSYGEDYDGVNNLDVFKETTYLQ